MTSPLRNLIFVALMGLFTALVWYNSGPHDCTTDAECAAIPACVLTPGCDGGPDPEHQPYAWLP